MNIAQITEIQTCALHVMSDESYRDDIRASAAKVQTAMVANLAILAGGNAEARSTDNCAVFAVWTPVDEEPFTSLLSIDYEIARLSMHS